MLLKQTNKILRLFLPFVVILAFGVTHFSASASAAREYVDVDRSNTVFYQYQDKNIFIAVRDNKIAVFSKEANVADSWSQNKDYYGDGTIDCGAHIIHNDQKYEDTTLYEAEKNGCKDDQYHEGKIDLLEADDSIIKAAANINWGNEPLGCPGFKDIPGSANKDELNYNCPKGGAVIKGKYDKNAKIDTPRLPGANTSECGDVAGGFGWIICESAEKIGDFAMWFEEQLYRLLRISELPMDANGGIYQAWSSIRTVAVTVLVLVALLAIASQIFNFDFISAYTIKKIVPKIVIATILIFTSYYLAAMGITFVNALGDGVNALIMAPFPELLDAYNQNETISFILSSISGVGGGETAVAGGIIVGASIAAVGGAGLFGLLIPIALVAGAVIVAFITLVLRKVFILALVLIMPLAIVAWILPGTQKWFDSWWKLFSKLLLMYPLVIGLLAVGKVAAYLIATGTEVVTTAALPQMWSILAVSGQASIVILMVLIAYFGPYYFIPSMFKTAGGVFGKITSGMQSFGSKYARKGGEAASKNVGDWASSNYSNKGNKFRNALIRTGTGSLRLTPKGNYRQRAMLANRGAEYDSKRAAEDAALVSSEIYGMDFDPAMDHITKKLGSKGVSSRERGAYAEHLRSRGKEEKIAEAIEEARRRGDTDTITEIADVLRKKTEVGKAFTLKRPDIQIGMLSTTEYGGTATQDQAQNNLRSYMKNLEADKVAQLAPSFFQDDELLDSKNKPMPYLDAHGNEVKPTVAGSAQSRIELIGEDKTSRNKLLASVRSMPIYGQLKGPARKVIDDAVAQSQQGSGSGGGGNSSPSSGGGGNSSPSSGGGTGGGTVGGGTVGGNSGQSTPATPSSRGPISDADISRIVNAMPKYMPSQTPFQGGQTVHLSKENIKDLSHETAKETREISKDDKDDDKGPPR